MKLEGKKIAIIGLGYVGLPLAVEFAKKYATTGFDIDKERVKELRIGNDSTLEVDSELLTENLRKSKSQIRNQGLYVTFDIEDISECDIYIVTVPTPIDEFKAPNLKPLLKASEMIGTVLKKGDVVIYESTTYPGCTEEDCVPVLEKESGLKFNKDFFCGYSPERINPGDKINTLTSIKKVTSGSNLEIATFVDDLYKSIITAGTHLAPSIKVAEASKAIENAQRDVNISFVNELALIFDKVGIDTADVLAAAGTKWNFLKYKPGLVGGHCIGVDPYYLAHKSQALGYHPAVILSGRRVNDNMGMFVANKVVKLMIQKEQLIKNTEVLVLGITFKENCPDIRNTRVVDIISELQGFGCNVHTYDPWANKEEVRNECGVDLLDEIPDMKFSAIILAVAHKEFLELEIQAMMQDNAIVFDTKGVLPRDLVDARL